MSEPFRCVTQGEMCWPSLLLAIGYHSLPEVSGSYVNDPLWDEVASSPGWVMEFSKRRYTFSVEELQVTPLIRPSTLSTTYIEQNVDFAEI